MIAAQIIRQVLHAGGQIAVDGADLVLSAPRPLPADLLDRLKAHKPAILEALGQPPASKRRGLGGYTTPPGVAPLSDCELARQIPSMPDPVPGEASDLREFFRERAGILEHDAGLTRPEAEREAARITAAYARNRGCLWASLPAALAGYPLLLSQVPDRAGTVDELPLSARPSLPCSRTSACCARASSSGRRR